MAFSYGFFNAKNLDRTYTAENFCDYLGSIICNGIQDNYGGCFKPTASKLKLAIASGKAWIDGHYFISDTAYTFDLSKYVDESLPRYISIGICCNKSENYRKIEFEFNIGTPATNPTIPKFENTDDKTYLTLCAVKIEADSTEISIIDYREDDKYCGYVRCILGKCRITEVLDHFTEVLKEVEDYKTEVTGLSNKVEELNSKVYEIGGDIIEIGKCGENINYVLYSGGKLILTGTGAMFDYGSSVPDLSPFYNNSIITSVSISEGVTNIGDYAFNFCNNLKKALLPTTIERIGRNSFMPHIDEYVNHKNLYGLTELIIPNNVTEIARNAFYGTNIQTVTIPPSLVTVEALIFGGCQNLTSVRYEGRIISDRMFASCKNLNSFTIAKTCKEISAGCFNYCDMLTEITYEGDISEWNSITKRPRWDSTINGRILKIFCLDGFLEWDSENNIWKEVGETT